MVAWVGCVAGEVEEEEEVEGKQGEEEGTIDWPR